MIADADDPRLDELLLRWEEFHEQGQSLSADELCSTCPELAGELGRRIALLRKMDPLLGETNTALDDPASATPAGGSNRESATARADFRDLRFHAAGALGEVFLARNAELNREVALKFLKPERSRDPDSLRRFLREAEVTGRLEHPGVVPIYALGTDATGTPCYAMRFIRGETLQDPIDTFHATEKSGRDPSERSLALRELLNRFVSICNTMAYAHSRGILHRDLKPRNVMLGKYDETLVLDWGLAKPFDRNEAARSVGEETLMPTSGSGSGSDTPTVGVVGTPAFMSPEQAEARRDIVGPASDIFGLGAILYTILTGRAPYQGRKVNEILEKVKRCESPAPRQIKPGVSRALEAVCLKAMAPKPEDRYLTALELAADIRRWLADEPVTAWREPLSRRARRWARRNRTAVISLAASVLVALAGTAAVLAVQTEANGRLKQAYSELVLANEREKQRFDLAMEAIKLFHGEVGDDLVLKADQFKPLRDKLLRGALDFYGKLEELLKGQTDRGSRGAIGNAYFELGELTSKIGDKPAALAAHRKGLAVRQELASEPAAAAEDRGDVAKSLHAAAFLLDQTGNSAEALARFEEARDLLEDLPVSGPGSDGRRALLGTVYRRIGRVLANTGKTTAAMTAYQRSVETLTRLADDNPAVTEFRSDLSRTHNIIGNLQSDTGKPGEALESYRRAVAIRQKLADDNPAVTEFQSRLADSHNNIGILQMHTGKLVEALESYRRALAIRQKLADDNPAVTELRNDLANSHNNIGNLQSNTGKLVEALESFRRALAIQQRLADDNPAVTDFRSNLADSHTNIGLILARTGTAAETVAEFSREEAIRTRLVQVNPSVPDYRNDLANCHTNTATALIRFGRPAEARALCERAVELQEALVKDHPDSSAYRLGLGESLLRSGLARRDEGDAAGAAADWRRADALLEGAGAMENEYRFVHICCHASLSWAAGRPGSGVSADEAGAEAAKAIVLLRSAAAMGYRDLATYRNETALDPLRGRDDFRLLLMDLAMPAEPFAE